MRHFLFSQGLQELALAMTHRHITCEFFRHKVLSEERNEHDLNAIVFLGVSVVWFIIRYWCPGKPLSTSGGEWCTLVYFLRLTCFEDDPDDVREQFVWKVSSHWLVFKGTLILGHVLIQFISKNCSLFKEEKIPSRDQMGLEWGVLYFSGLKYAQ